MRGLLEAVVVILEAVRVFAGAFVMSTKSKWKHKRSDIEAKPKHVDVFQNLKWNVSIYSKNFGTNQNFFMCSNFFAKAKAKRYFFIQ